MQMAALIVPGIGNSGAAHWQTLWQQQWPWATRIAVPDWDRPVLADWMDAIEQGVLQRGGETVIIAHSLGCIAVAHWAAATRLRVRGTLLVAVPDPAGPAFPAEAAGFVLPPLRPLPFPAIVVASCDDPYGSMAHASRCAQGWGGELVNVGASGHINAASGLGDWPAGRSLLGRLSGT
ncbi:hypothetical protein SAMN02745857_01870 [Andreprevotia lacus DSM 23236]|uniref:Alpha/beta hydrolase family protein n=1 Tax=Andreprevotia lacus DSM 23236 TaxID=1121001 RepID=A0A1W1XKL6_9NEIS|nr:alpha/beta hydrolase [Andreprevotia lacus]SMC24357.1 hypothetical protein SAMN02745857_01870 [Andreprevotia lacus DSM 23236]